MTMIAVMIGGVAGLFLGFLWLLALPLLLAVGVEWLIQRKRLGESARIGAQVGIGMLVGGILQFLVALAMVLWIVVDWWVV